MHRHPRRDAGRPRRRRCLPWTCRSRRSPAADGATPYRLRVARGLPSVAAAHPLLREAVGHVAHYQIRNRGTVGGSLAHADPAPELPGVAVTCEAEITIVGPRQMRPTLDAERPL